MIKLNYTVYFFSTNLWFSDCFKAVNWITLFFLSSILQTSFSTFSIFLLSRKSVKSLWRLNNYFRYSTSTSRKNLFSLFSLYLFINLSLNFDNISAHLKSSTGSFWDIAHRCFHPKTLDMTIQCFDHNYSYIYCLL